MSTNMTNYFVQSASVGTGEERPWGAFIILDEPAGAKVKRLVVRPGQRLSLQSHRHRDEHWIVIAGNPLVTLDDRQIQFGYGDHIFVPRGTKHRITCAEGATTVEIIEVQTGDSFSEDDITRYDDDYGR